MDSGWVKREMKRVICKWGHLIFRYVLICDSIDIDIDCFTSPFAGVIVCNRCGGGEIHDGGIAPFCHLALQVWVQSVEDEFISSMKKAVVGVSTDVGV